MLDFCLSHLKLFGCQTWDLCITPKEKNGAFSFNLLQNENPAIQRITGFFISFYQTFVELERIELSSKQGNPVLSTRLFQT